MNIMCAYLLSLLLASVASAVPTTPDSSYNPKKLFSRGGPSIQATDPFDRRWIETLTALGDSYSVGYGAGHAVKATAQMELNTDCYQYSYGYPNLVNMDDMIAENNQRHFQYLGCSGALTGDIKDVQIPKMQKSQAVLISAGGNDAHLSIILNYCVYQWSSKWYWTCDGELDSGEAEVKSDSYSKSMTDMLTAVEAELVDGNSRIYWPGYIRFFDDTSKDCDAVTWAFSRNYGFRQYLTQARRTRFNDLVNLVNEKIQAACKTVDRCVYVDSEPQVDQLGGRFCMPGINEKYYGGVNSPTDGWNRERTIFYEWSTTKDNDVDGEKSVDQPQKRDGHEEEVASFISLETRNDAPGSLDNKTFEGNVGNWIQEGIADGTLDTTAASFGEVNAQGLPEWIGRVFHLTKSGNAIVANNIIQAMVIEQGKMMNQPADPTLIDTSSCPASGTTSNPPAIGSVPAPGPVVPYVTTGGNGTTIGKCHVHVNEFQNCMGDARNLATEVTIWDVGGNQIGYQSVTEAGATDPLSVNSKLEVPLIVIPEHRHDYVHFSLGTEQFDSRQVDQTAFSWCSTGGWDPSQGPACGRVQQSSKRQIDCYFQCPYHGGKSSDGS